MQKKHISTLIQAAAAFPLVLCCAALLNSCKDKGTEKPAPVEKVAASTTPIQTDDQADAQTKQLLDFMIFNVGDALRREAGQPMWRELVRDMRNQVEAYYNALRTTNKDPERLVRIGLFLADGARDLSAFPKAADIYTATLKDWEALPEEIRDGINGQRLRSFLLNGLGSCLMQQRKMTEALPYYEEALKLDQARYNSVSPGEGKPLPTADHLSPELENAAKDLLSSYRCLAECQLFADDPEQARETLQTGRKLATDMRNLSTKISFEFIHLLSTLGNLESRVGQPRKALEAWRQAAYIAEQLRIGSSSPAEQAQAIQLIRKLKTVQSQLQSQQPSQDNPEQ